MRYKRIAEGRFLERLNRFVARVEIDGREETVHVKNTGRCRELLIPSCRVWLEISDNPNRKTAYDLVTVEKRREGKPPLTVNLDSQIVNGVAEEWLKAGNLFPVGATVRREVTHGNSRFDFYLEQGDRKAFLEVKGVTLEFGGVASFPDAPTERGVKHLTELTALCAQGYEAYVLFVVAMEGMEYVHPNDRTHRAFGDALREAEAAGVRILAVECAVTPDSVTALREIPVKTQLTEE